jgi:hypothetical protein
MTPLYDHLLMRLQHILGLTMFEVDVEIIVRACTQERYEDVSPFGALVLTDVRLSQ